MHIDRQIAIWAGWIAGPAFGVAMMAAPEYLKLQPPLSGILFWGGITVFLATIVIVIALSIHDERRRPKVILPIIMMAIGLLIFFGGATWYFWLTQREIVAEDHTDRDQAISAQPDIVVIPPSMNYLLLWQLSA
jgi:drug/metabolite transporter (DMT)-like permease